MYALQQVCIWGGVHAGFLFWGLRYPFSYRTFKLSGRARYAHIISILLAVLVPLPGALVHLEGGYVLTGSPSLVCAGRNTDYTYYTFILPLSIILAVTTCLLVLIFSIILKVRKKVQQGVPVIDPRMGQRGRLNFWICPWVPAVTPVVATPWAALDEVACMIDMMKFLERFIRGSLDPSSHVGEERSACLCMHHLSDHVRVVSVVFNCDSKLLSKLATKLYC